MFLSRVTTFFNIQFSRYLRHPFLWLVALAIPIAARFMVPTSEASYTVVAINNAYPVLTPSVIGMELGIITALLLTPLAYMYLRSGPARITPWQVESVTPGSRISQMVGYWLADVAVLWLIMLCLAIAGVILSAFRLEFANIRPHETVIALCLIAGPALAFIAAVRIFWSARPWLRGGLGDVGFLLFWLLSMVLSILLFQTGLPGSEFADIYGFVASMSGAVSVPIEAYTVGSAPSANGFIEVDAMRGVTDSDFLWSRLFWVFTAFLLVCFAGLVFKPPKYGTRKNRLSKLCTKLLVNTKLFGAVGRIKLVIFNRSSQRLAPLWSNISQILMPVPLIVVVMSLSVLGAFLPFRGGVGATLWLVLIFPLTQHSARWQSENVSQLKHVMPMGADILWLWRLLAGVVIAFAACLPALITMIINGTIEQIPDIVFISLAVPLIAMAIGQVARSAFAGRMILLIIWYGYLNI